MSHISYRLVYQNRCPACGNGKIYKGMLAVSDACLSCGFSLKAHDAGDGPAFFAMSFASVLVILLAWGVEQFYALPLYAIILVYSPVIVGLSIWFLRLCKSFLIHQQYHHNIGQYRK